MSPRGPQIRLLVVQPDPLAPLFAAEEWLRDEGVEWAVVRPFDGDVVPERLELDALVVLGGSMSSLDDDDYPWLEDIRSLQRDAAAKAAPSLGVCLGAQLMAQAFGGATAKGDRGLEAGVAWIRWSDAAQHDPVTGDLPGRFPAGTMHGDMVTDLPLDATLLGTGSVYRHQAFRVGATSWGVQFHPEIDHRAYQTWVKADGAAASDGDRVRLRDGGRELLANQDRVLGGNGTLVRNFLRTARSAIASSQGGLC